MSKIQKICEKILRSKGPMLTGELATALLAETGKDNINAARQAVYRLSHPIKKIENISFDDNQKFIFLKEQEDLGPFRRTLISKLVEHRTAAGRAILALRAKKQIFKEHFPIIAGVSHLTLGKNLNSEEVYKQLEENKLIIETIMPNEKVVISVAGDETATIFSFEILNAIEKLILEMCKEWALRIGFGSTNKLKTKNEELPLPDFGFFSWDLCGASYLIGLKTYDEGGEPIPGGFFADVYLKSEELKKGDLESYLNKVFALKKQRGSRYLPALIHQGMSLELIMDLRNIGIMCLEVRSFGDKKVGELVSELILLVNNIRSVVGDEEKLSSILDKMLSKEYGRLLNLPGPLFMMTVAYLYKHEYSSVVPNEIVASKHGKAEIDVFVRQNHRDIIAIECKGYKADKRLDMAEIEEWIDTKRPKIIEWYRSVSQAAGYQSLKFQFIISSKFTEDELKHLRTLADNAYKQFPVEFLDINYVVGLAKKHKLTKVVEGLKENF
jgi:uncharacterized protein YuzE